MEPLREIGNAETVIKIKNFYQKTDQVLKNDCTYTNQVLGRTTADHEKTFLVLRLAQIRSVQY